MSPLHNDRPSARTPRSRKRGKGTGGSYVSRRHSQTQSPSPSETRLPASRAQTYQQDQQLSTQSETLAPGQRAEQQLSPPLSLELETVRKERDNALEVCNKQKMELMSLKTDMAQVQTINKCLREKVDMLQQELDNERLKTKNLELLNSQQASSTSTPRRTSCNRFITKVTKSIDRQYLSLAVAVERLLYDWAQAETSEIILSNLSSKKRNWMNRMTIVPNFGIERINSDTGEAVYFVPTLITTLIYTSDPFFSRSFDSYESVLEELTKKTIADTTWSAFRPNERMKQDTITTVSSNKAMISRVKQSLSDMISNRKRQVRDELFQSLKYFSLKSSHDRRRETPLFDKSLEIETAKQKLLRHVSQGDSQTEPHVSSFTLDYSTWRVQPLVNLTSDGTTANELSTADLPVDKPTQISVDTLDDESENSNEYGDARNPLNTSCLGLFTNGLARHLWTLFIGFDPNDEDHDDSNNEATSITETSILSLTRLDAWITTVVQLLVVNETRGGGRQRDYINTFHTHYVAATNQLLSRVFQFVKHWEPQELQVCEVHGENFKEAVLNMERVATIILHCPIQNKYYIAVKAEWFRCYISSCMGTVHDCYIAVVSDDWKNIDPLTVGDLQQQDISSDIQEGSRSEDTVPEATVRQEIVPPSIVPGECNPTPHPTSSSNPAISPSAIEPLMDVVDDEAFDTVPPISKT